MKTRPFHSIQNGKFIDTFAGQTWRKSQKGFWVVAMAGILAGHVLAEPFSDNLETLSHISNDSGNCVFTQDAEGRMLVTKNSDETNIFPATFGWNIEKASRENGFSLNPEDEQFVLEIKGITPVTGGKAQAKLFVVPFFGRGTESLGPFKGGDRAHFIPVEPDENGTWRFDVSEMVGKYFGDEERPTWWFPEVIIDSGGDTETGYAFASISAVGKTPQVESPTNP